MGAEKTDKSFCSRCGNLVPDIEISMPYGASFGLSINPITYATGGVCSGDQVSDIDRFSEHIINHKTGKISRHK
jgi:hypothetical protein